jgi:hypothetical protein
LELSAALISEISTEAQVHHPPFEEITMGRLLQLVCGFILIVAAAGFAQARDDDESEPILKASLLACPHDGTILGGVHSCGKIWNLKEGRAQLSADGKLRIEVEGLVLNDPTLPPSVNGTPDGVTAVAGVLVCGGSGGAIAAQTALVTINTKGDAKIHETLTLPKPCIGPVVLVREFFNNQLGGWLAATGK